MPTKEKLKSAEQFFSEIAGIIKVPEYYKKIENELKHEKEEDNLAHNFGFDEDTYYTARQKMNSQNEKNMNDNIGKRGSLNKHSKC